MAGLQRYLRALLLSLLALCVRGLATAAPQYIGSEVCKTCHPGVSVNFYKNPHYKSLVTPDTPVEKAGCESCHGPASEHVAGKGDKSKIAAFSELKPQQILNRCLACHAESLGRANIRRSQHTLAQVACTSCHSIHKAKTHKFLLAKDQRDVCYDCHPAVRAQFSLPFKHRVNEGFANCTDCHNPHGTAAANWAMGSRPRMVDATASGEEPCMKCHTDKRGPFAFEHPAIRVDGCGSCHAPHGSANARLLKRPAVFTLCLECHNGASGFGRQGDGITLTPPTHNMADPRFRNCTTCHVRIHGSNADSRFLR